MSSFVAFVSSAAAKTYKNSPIDLHNETETTAEYSYGPYPVMI